MKNCKHLVVVLIFSCCVLTSCKKVWHIAQSEYTLNRLDSTAIYSDEVTKMIQPYKVKLDGEMNKVIANCPEDMPKGRPESRLGNWMSDALYDRATELSDVPIDFAMQNSGGIRIPLLRKGEITKGKIYELMPFDNTLVVIHADKDLVMTFLNRVAQSGGWPVSKNFHMKIKDKEAAEVLINGKALTDRIYNIALPDYIANGGSDCSFFIDANRTSYPELLRDMFIKRATADGMISSTIEGRITK